MRNRRILSQKRELPAERGRPARAAAEAGNRLAPVLPDLRNIGVIARNLLAVHAVALFAASLGDFTWSSFADRTLNYVVCVAPALCASLAVLWIAYPLLVRMRYVRALGLIVLSNATIAYLTQWGLAGLADDADFGGGRAAFYAALGTLCLAAYFHLRHRAFSPAIAEARLHALQSRIRPHFLFNTLNAVLSLIRSDPVRAEAAVEDMAELYRMVLSDNKRLITLQRELHMTRQYLNLEQLRLGERLLIEWRVETAPDDALVPPLLLQPLVENAVYHGIEPGIGPGTIDLSVARLRDRVQVRLRNPYHPDHQHRQWNRIAMSNIRERLALHFDVEATLESGVKGDCFEIRMDLPYKRKAAA